MNKSSCCFSWRNSWWYSPCCSLTTFTGWTQNRLFCWRFRWCRHSRYAASKRRRLILIIPAWIYITNAVLYRSTTNIEIETETESVDFTPAAAAVDKTCCTPVLPSSAPSFCKSRKTKFDPVEQELLKILKKEEPDDPDKSFFLSLYGDFKLPDHIKVHTKLKLQQLHNYHVFNIPEQ